MSNKKDKHLMDTLRYYFAENPQEVDGVYNASVAYWTDYLFRLVFGAFEWENVPDEWDKDYMYIHLFKDGYFTITDTAMGVLPLKCGFYGVNVFDRPTNVNVANHVLGNFSRIIGVDCALVRLQYDYHGISDLVNRTAVMLAMADSGIAVNLMNSKVAFIGFAEDKAQAATMQKMYDMISAGSPAVFVRRGQIQKDDFYFNHVKNNFVADEIQLVQRKVIDAFLTSIGINNANTDKRERLIKAEAESNDTEVQASVEHWLKTVNDTLDVANKLYNLDMRFKRVDFKPDGIMDNIISDRKEEEAE